MAILILSTTLIGLSAAVFSYAGRDYYWYAVGYVESDFRDKLRRLRVSAKNLRKMLVGWSFVVLLSFLGFWLLGNSFLFGLTAAALLISLPWYLLRRMAERRTMQIEDQMADAMVALSSAIKAGLSLAQALEILAQQCPSPICQEFSAGDR